MISRESGTTTEVSIEGGGRHEEKVYHHCTAFILMVFYPLAFVVVRSTAPPFLPSWYANR